MSDNGRVRRMLCAAILAGLAACGGSSPSSPSTGGTTVTISSSGVSPSTLTVSPGTRILFVNNDNRSHNMTSDPHPDHNDCPELNAVGFLQPGQTRESSNLNTVRTCGFHDHDDPPPGGARWTGRITIR